MDMTHIAYFFERGCISLVIESFGFGFFLFYNC